MTPWITNADELSGTTDQRPASVETYPAVAQGGCPREWGTGVHRRLAHLKVEVISPLLANCYLHVLDMYWAERYSSLGKLVRYADDFVIICRTQREAQEALQKVKQIMTRLKLTLHPTKTRIVDMNQEGFDFLGFHFHKGKSGIPTR